MTMTAEHYAQPHQSERDALSAEIDSLETEIKEAEADAEGDHDNKDYIRVLTQHREKVQTKLTKIQAAGANGWMIMKGCFAKIIPRLKL